MEPLFIFGTLQHRPLLEAVLGRSDGLTLSPNGLAGYQVCSSGEGPFPTLAEVKDATAQGLLVNGLEAEDFARLDYYEGAFGYNLKPVRLMDGQAAQAYFPPVVGHADAGLWDLDAWICDWADLSILAATEVMQYRGQKTPVEMAEMFPIIRARAWSTLNAQSSRHGALTLQGRVEVHQLHRPYAKYFALDEYELSHQRFDGTMSAPVMRAVFRAPDATLVLPYDPYRDAVLLVEQVRMGPLARGDGTMWQLEPIAGRLDAGETPQAAARREALEEAGLEMGELIPVAEVYCSPGNSSEFYYIFAGIADLPPDAAGVGGLAEEHEDIRSHILSFGQLMELCDSLQFANAPLVMAAYWLDRHRGRLRASAGVR